MTDIIIFGGTSEGRRLAEFCAARKIRAAVSVATGYGESLLKETPWLGIHTGRMDREQMEAWLAGQNPRLVLDATHPYAVQATENIRLACGGLGLPLLRVLRGESGEDGGSRVVTVGSVEEAAAYLDGQEGTILVTTGSKELRAFASLKHCGERVFARVLPSPPGLGGLPGGGDSAVPHSGHAGALFCGTERGHDPSDRGRLAGDQGVGESRRV